MTRARNARPSPVLRQGLRYFDPLFLNQERADRLWERCIYALDKSHVAGQAAGGLMVGRDQAEICAIYDTRGQLVRFWLRTLIGNRLVIVGNHDGLLPLDVGALHAR